jgi:2-polyprenyl-3-methyl-5-hydroxy-6-metoxy-1,4-benzoquinol methylase
MSETTVAQLDIRLTERSACLLCNTAGEVMYAGLHDRLYDVPGEWTLCKCPSCGLAWLNPLPIEADIGKVYARYFTHETGKPAWQSDNPVYRAWVKAGGVYRAAINNSFMGEMRRQADSMYLGAVTPGRLLDVGCGDGGWLVKMRTLGWQVEGQETDADAAAYAERVHGVTVHLGLLHDLRLPPASFDAITLSHVIEHVHDPIAVLAECRRLLKPDGRLIALTPNVAGYGHKRFGVNWVALEPPRHLTLFSPATLADVGKRAGFAQASVKTTQVRAQFIHIASSDIQRNGHHALHASYSLAQLATAMRYEWQAWSAWRADPASGDELVLEARP